MGVWAFDGNDVTDYGVTFEAWSDCRCQCRAVPLRLDSAVPLVWPVVGRMAGQPESASWGRTGADGRMALLQFGDGVVDDSDTLISGGYGYGCRVGCSHRG